MDPRAPLRLAYLADPNSSLSREWMAFFARRGHEVSLVAEHGATIDEGLDPSITVVRMRPFSGRIFGRLAILDGRRALRAATDRVRPDLLHVHDLTTGFGWTARASGFRPYVLTTWGSDIYLAVRRSWQARLIGRLTLSGAALVTMESRDLGRASIEAGAHPDRIRLIQFGVDTARYRPAEPDPALRSRLGLEGRRVIFSPRQIAPLYDHVAVVRAAAGLPEDVVVLMSARDAHPAYLRAVEEAASESGLGSRLIVVPGIDRDEMAAFYPLSDLVVSVPHSDSISVSVLEAMSSGRPVVATDLPSPREWLLEVWPDLLVPPGDPVELRRAFETVLAMAPDERQRRGDLSRRIVTERAERETNMLAMERLYRSVVTARPRGAS